jgi:hypothetical protein
VQQQGPQPLVHLPGRPGGRQARLAQLLLLLLLLLGLLTQALLTQALLLLPLWLLPLQVALPGPALPLEAPAPESQALLQQRGPLLLSLLAPLLLRVAAPAAQWPHVHPSPIQVPTQGVRHTPQSRDKQLQPGRVQPRCDKEAKQRSAVGSLHANTSLGRMFVYCGRAHPLLGAAGSCAAGSSIRASLTSGAPSSCAMSSAGRFCPTSTASVMPENDVNSTLQCSTSYKEGRW